VKFQTKEKANFNISAVLLEDLSEKLNLMFFSSVYSCFARRDGFCADGRVVPKINCDTVYDRGKTKSLAGFMNVR
jgi:hypothetical protein